MIGITGVTETGSYVADLIEGIASVHLKPRACKVYASAEIRRMSYTNTPKVVEALKDRYLVDGFCPGKSGVSEAQGVLPSAEVSISFIPPFMGLEGDFHLVSRSCPD